MADVEHEVALEDTDRIHGRTALVRNVAAAVSLSNAIRSTLGPRGLDKMLVNDAGEATVTNDGVTVLETARVEHPTANLLIASSSSQDKSARDGTTTTVILMAEMLQNSLELVRSGVHPSLIINGYRIANEEALRELDSIARIATDKNMKRSVVRTSLQGKIDHLLSSHLTELALDAAEALVGEEGGNDLERLRIKRIQISGGKALDSELVPALVLAKTRIDRNTPRFSDGGNIAILDGALENQKLELEAQIEVNDLGVLKEFHERDNNHLQDMVDHLHDLKIDLLIVRDGIADDAVPMLSRAGITAYRRFEREDLERLSRLTGTNMIRKVGRITKEDIGSYSSRSEENIGSVNYTKIEGTLGGAMTMILRGSTPELRDEVGRSFDDALGVSYRLITENRILPGGGATQTHLARKLRHFSTTQSGREQMAIEAYAAALEIVPRTLAENAGHDPIDTLLTLSAAQSKNVEEGPWIGVNGNTGEVTNMYEEGIFDPIFVARHAITGATEAAISVLRIDDVLWAKQGPETPDWSNQIDDN
ncbi:MAG: TCP-1/cpn60 chaperonin family protein [Candidatus Thalassarchaeaceae archaeon]|nr:TCP-1/cpn60 chaperonin family protein [Candidatus Thalassarchaeaceae archaeon]